MMNAPSTDRTYTISARLPLPYAEAVEEVRRALADQGFGILTEIDLAATLKAKLDRDIPPQVILGACRPGLAYEALQADPSLAALLPCNVVVRQLDAGTLVEAFDPLVMLTFSTSPVIGEVVADARHRLRIAVESLESASDAAGAELGGDVR
jgi:uncharacterized protein (DUF302 family)